MSRAAGGAVTPVPSATKRLGQLLGIHRRLLSADVVHGIVEGRLGAIRRRLLHLLPALDACGAPIAATRACALRLALFLSRLKVDVPGRGTVGRGRAAEGNDPRL